MESNGSGKLQEVNRFKVLQDFTKEIQAHFKISKVGDRVFKKMDDSGEDERYEILLFLRLFLKSYVN